MNEKLRQVLQEILDADSEGWLLDHFVIVLGLQRITASGEVEHTAWVTGPRDQADYVTDGLLSAAVEMREGCDVEGD